MTDPTDSPSSKPISVAELLAKNGSIGSPPVGGGRRRRRRGDTGSISVAELTGEIPIYQTGEIPVYAEDEPVADPLPYATGEIPIGSTAPSVTTPPEADDIDDTPMVDGDAEQMSPDPMLDLDLGVDDEDDDDVVADLVATTREAPPSYVRSAGPLFGGQSDDGLHQGRQNLDEIEHVDDVSPTAGSGPSTFLAGVWVIGQCILAVIFGAGLFIAFDQLWQWNTIVALVLSVLVILGLVVGVRVVRKTEDIGSTLIAVAVGAMVTLGPLALLRSH